MKISYDKATDSLYIHLADRPSVDSDEVNDGVVLDFDANGALVGIDVQHASKRANINNLSVSKMPSWICYCFSSCLRIFDRVYRPIFHITPANASNVYVKHV